MTKVEEIARAMADAVGENFTELPENYCAMALAALKAMREPSEEMMKAAGATEGMREVNDMVINHQIRTGVRLKWDVSPLVQAWNAMIDAAIAEHEGWE